MMGQSSGNFADYRVEGVRNSEKFVILIPMGNRHHSCHVLWLVNGFRGLLLSIPYYGFRYSEVLLYLEGKG